MNPEDRRKIARIDQISGLARTSWIGLLAYLAFIFVTLLGVEDADFFVPSRQTQLPLVNVSIPTASFFIFAPVLAAALYVYLHLFLIKLWDAIADAEPTIRTDPERNERIPLSDAIHPWLANDLATAMRGNGARPEPDRPMRWLSTLVTWALVWIAGPFVLLMLWWWSAPAHNEGLTLLIALCLFVATIAGSVSWFRARASLKGRKPALWRRLARWTVTTAFGLALLAVSVARTEGGLERWASWSIDQAQTLFQPDAPFLQACRPPDFDPGAEEISDRRFQGPMPICFDRYGVKLPPEMIRERHIRAIDWLPGDENRLIRAARRLLDRWLDETWLPLARTDLSGEALGVKPSDWLDHDIARRRAREAWCKGRDIPLEACDLIATDIEAAADLWCEEQDGKAACPDRLRAQVTRFDEEWAIDRAAYLGNLTVPDLAGRDLRQADLLDAFLPRANLSYARMEGADLREARLEGASLREAGLEGADLSEARLEGANLSGARMERTNLWEARLEEADLSGARMEGADLRRARLDGADLGKARMEGADLSGARLKGADLDEARMEGANLWEARLEEADLSGARMEGADLRWARMEGADISGARMEGADISRADLRSAKWAGGRTGARAHSADLRGAKGLTQGQLDQMIGNSETLLPETLDDGSIPSIPSCWTTPPPFIEAMIRRVSLGNRDRAIELRIRFLCLNGTEPSRFSTPLPLDAPYPNGHPLADRKD